MSVWKYFFSKLQLNWFLKRLGTCFDGGKPKIDWRLTLKCFTFAAYKIVCCRTFASGFAAQRCLPIRPLADTQPYPLVRPSVFNDNLAGQRHLGERQTAGRRDSAGEAGDERFAVQIFKDLEVEAELPILAPSSLKTLELLKDRKMSDLVVDNFNQGISHSGGAVSHLGRCVAAIIVWRKCGRGWA